MPDESPQSLLAPALNAARSPAQLDALAAELERIAAHARALAAAKRRAAATPGDKRATPHSPKAGPGRAPSSFVRLALEPWGARHRLRLYIGRALYYALGSPARLDLQRIGAGMELRPASGDQGIAFTAGKGMPRAFVDGWADVLGMESGRYAAEVRGGAIVIGGRMD